ncbi:MAG: enoyl-CoA hydratase [Anaerolineales bacterium]|jgi:2-(1,2-epoxy-1,2-dihydrophenyl)acetyl-CoA isomerase
MTTLLTGLQSATLTISLNRPERANAFNFEMIAELRAAFEEAATDSQVRCVVLTGAGASFCAGHDITEMLAAQGGNISYRKHLDETYNPLILQIRQLEKPVIAAVNGPVAGAGLGVALACDMRIASETALFTVGFSGIGLVPDSAVSLLLPALIGLGRATEFTFNNQPITTVQALEWGMVNQVVPDDRLVDTVGKLAAGLTSGPTSTYGLTKRLFNQNVLPNLEEALAFEGEMQEVASQRAEHVEGVKAFLEKRKPSF